MLSSDNQRAIGDDMEKQKVSANPTKAFFVHTITRDIRLEDCILDLVDNSLDGARNLLHFPVPSLSDKSDFSQFRVKIAFDEDSFSVTDNCGGISLSDAVNYAFTFGRMDADTSEDYSIGVYGIGMKRAVFKMGDNVKIRSTFGGVDREAEEPFVVEIDVPAWLKAKDWDFDLSPDEPLDAAGVQIQVEGLREVISNEFSNPVFSTSLRKILARDYARFIDRGLVVEVNGKKVRPFDFSLLTSDKIVPLRAEFSLKAVKVEIIAGMAARPTDDADPDHEGEKEDRSGWYVLCNDRMVVAADKSELTGWGYGGKNRWHPQYRGFLGIILFSAKEADALPLTTTKRSIDRDSELYRLALARMIELTREWIEYTNRRKAALDEARKFEAEAVAVKAFSTSISKALKFPSFISTRIRSSDVTIQYSKPTLMVRDVAQKFGNPGMSAREVGMRTFEYTYRELIGGQ